MDTALTEGYSVELTLNNIDPKEFLYLSAQVGNQLGWLLMQDVEDKIVFKTNSSATSHEEEVTIRTEESKAYLTSRSTTEYLYDQQQNITNITVFQNTFTAYYQNLLQRQRVSYNPFPTQTPVSTTASQKISRPGGWGALVPSRIYIVTPILIYLNLLVFLLMTVSGISPIHPTSHALLEWGGNFRQFVIHGQPWRLFTYMFLHAGIMHLAGNIFALLYIGLHLEPILGKLRYASAYILSGIAAGLLSMTVHGFSVGVGASGAIFGLYGVFFAMLTTSFIQKTLRKTLLRSLLFFIVFNLLYGLSGNIDNAGHIGGLISGMLIGYAYLPGLKKYHTPKKQAVVIAVLTIAVAVVAVCSVLYFR